MVISMCDPSMPVINEVTFLKDQIFLPSILLMLRKSRLISLGAI